MEVSGFVTYFEFTYKDFENNKQLRDCLDNRQFLHKEIQKMFHSSRKDSQSMYRVESSKNGDSVITIQSNAIPDVEESSLFKKLKASKTIDMSSYYRGILNNIPVRFKLEAMPYYTFLPEGSKNHKRRVITDKKTRFDWLTKKLEKSGLKIQKLQKDQEMSQKFVSKNGCPNGFFKTYDFVGEAVVFDTDLLAKALENGIGPEKAYGAGLLILY